MSLGRFLIVSIVLCLSIPLFCQSRIDDLRPLARELAKRKEMAAQTIVPLFAKQRTGDPSLDLSAYVRESEFFRLDAEVLSMIRNNQPELITLPLRPDGQQILLELYRVELFSENYHLRTSEGVSFPKRNDMVFYRGIIAGDVNSLATLSIVQDEVRVMFSSALGNYRLHQVKDNQYVFYKDTDVYQTQSYECGVTEEHQIGGSEIDIQQRQVLTGNCVEVYFECDYKSYQDNGNSVTNTENWISAIFNEVATLYENEDIPVVISDIMVWTSTDPYAGLSNPSTMMAEFILQLDENGYEGRLAHLVSTRNLLGGVAYVDVLCHNTLMVAVSTSLSTNIVQFPTYSWSVNCVSHEMGHQFGSHHTHKCVWNGNNTQIDDCGSVYGDVQSCYNPNNPILPDDGTIMSYCHLIGGVGISFSLGFGPQPGDKIRSEYNGATCNTGTCSPPSCTDLTSPIDLAINIEVTANVFWASVSGANGYRLTMGTSPGSGNIVNNLDVGLVTMYDPTNAFPYNTNIYVKIVPYNSAGNATGCTEEHFRTELNVAPACTQITSPLNGAINVPVTADLFWTHSIGAQTGYKVTIGTTSGGGEILNLFNVGNVTTYNPAPFPPNTTIYVRITPYWSGGDITGCPVISFTTADAAYCSSQGNDYSDEWISAVSLGTFNHSSGAAGYSNFTGFTAHVSAGASYSLSVTPGFAGQSLPEFFRVWIDLNHNGTFENPGERVLQGTASGPVSGNVTIPTSAYIGTTRMRVAMKWGGYSLPCDVFTWGEVEDYTVHIHCNLVTNTANSGVGSLTWAVGCVASGETISFSSAINGDTIIQSSNQLVIDSPMSIIANPNNNISVYGLSTQKVFIVNSGVVASIKGLNVIAGTALEGSAIQNAGTLTIEDIDLFRHPGISNTRLIRNTGTLKIYGDCMLD